MILTQPIKPHTAWTNFYFSSAFVLATFILGLVLKSVSSPKAHNAGLNTPTLVAFWLNEWPHLYSSFNTQPSSSSTTPSLACGHTPICNLSQPPSCTWPMTLLSLQQYFPSNIFYSTFKVRSVNSLSSLPIFQPLSLRPCLFSSSSFPFQPSSQSPAQFGLIPLIPLIPYTPSHWNTDEFMETYDSWLFHILFNRQNPCIGYVYILVW